MLRRLAARSNVLAVVTQPDRPAGRGHKLTPTPVKAEAERLGLPVATPTRLRAFAADVAALRPDLCVVASYGRIVPAELLAAAPLWLNIHPSLLPLYRGATPIQSAIRDGRPSTALTIIAMDAGLDTGDVVVQSDAVAIGADETYEQLHDRLAALGAAMLDSALDAYEAGTLGRTPQAEHARALGISETEIARTLTRPLTKEDRFIAPFECQMHDAADVVNLIRSLQPSPGAVWIDETQLDGPLRVVAAHAEERPPHLDLPPGSLHIEDDRMISVPRGGGVVVYDRVVPAGKNEMTVDAYLRGRRQPR